MIARQIQTPRLGAVAGRLHTILPVKPFRCQPGLPGIALGFQPVASGFRAFSLRFGEVVTVPAALPKGAGHEEECGDRKFHLSVLSLLILRRRDLVTLSLLTMRRFLPILALLLPLAAQTFDPKLYSGLEWRMIGPFRGGRTVGAAGIADQPNVFYVGVNNGGVWKTDDFGMTWKPIFDSQPTGSIGTIAVAPSAPETIYVGSGEGLQRPDLSVGDGIYKSTDAGKTWSHLGLRDGQQIPAIIVDPRNPNRLFVAVLGHPYGPNAERGVFRSTDGGQTFEKVLYKDDRTGAVDLAFDPRNPQTVYAVLWQAQQGPWENGAFIGPNSGLFKSTDGGATWNQLTGGLPTFAQGLGRIGIGIAPSDPTRIYALVESREAGGLYRSDNAGVSWKLVNKEQRIYGRGSDFACVRVDPKNKDVAYVANTSTYRSTDGGQTFTAIKGAPGGDDYHTIWINPSNPNIILLALDQGATISVNYGKTWSSWYNQPTAQLYHVSTDNQFPYWVYGGQQESGSVGIASRGNDGGVTFRDWHSMGAGEYAYVTADPLNPNFVYGGGMGRGRTAVTRFDKTTGTVEDVGPPGDNRHLRTAPVIFSTVDPRILYFGTNMMHRTTDGGQHLGNHQPRSFAGKVRPPGQRRCLLRTGPEAGHAPRRGLLHCALPPQCGHHLGRHRRRTHPSYSRCRQNLERRDAARLAALEQSGAARPVSLRRSNRLRRHQSSARGRYEAAHLPHARWRRHLAGDSARSAGRSGQCGPRGFGAQGVALRRHGGRGVRIFQ